MLPADAPDAPCWRVLSTMRTSSGQAAVPAPHRYYTGREEHLPAFHDLDEDPEAGDVFVRAGAPWPISPRGAILWYAER